MLYALEGVKAAGNDKWIARCPAHDDRDPSLSIRSTDDRVLLHCHAGCETEAIVSAMGLELADLYHEALPKGERRQRALRASRRDMEAALNHELLVLAMTLGRRVTERDMPKGVPSGMPPLPEGHEEREAQAARKAITLIAGIYAGELQ